MVKKMRAAAEVEMRREVGEEEVALERKERVTGKRKRGRIDLIQRP